MARWVFPSDQPGKDLLTDFAEGKLLSQLLVSRGITDPESQRSFLNPDYYKPSPPNELPGVETAVEILLEALESKRCIGIWGDFDVDGQTATTLLVSALGKLGAKVVYHIPVRATESHGIKIDYLKEFLKEGVDVLVTCDTGISEHESIEYARKMGVSVIITDHHDLPDELPLADALINPNMLSPDHPLASLPGVGVAYKLIEALFTELEIEDQLDEYLDLVALGIVADVANLVGDTRYLLQLGLRQLRKTERTGLNALFKLAQIEKFQITEDDIGFGIGPRMNALGRLGDANAIVEFLMTEDHTFVEVFAQRLEGMNAQRKLLSSQILAGAMAQLANDPSIVSQPIIILASEHWPPGVIGIVASKLAQRYNKPVLLMQVTESGIVLGSARSVPGVDIGEAIRSCGDLLLGFGGHPMAAGLSLLEDNLPHLRSRLSKAIVDQVGRQVEGPEIPIDLVVNFEDLSLDFIQEIEQLAPFGPGNPAFIFAARNLSLVSQTLLGRTQAHRRLFVEDQFGEQQTVFLWDGAEWDVPNGEFDLAFTARENFFRGEHSVQLVVKDIQAVSSLPAQVKNEIEIQDHRTEPDRPAKLESISSGLTDYIIWGEGEYRVTGKVHGREDLVKAKHLIIWTIPPSYKVLKLAVEKVAPSVIHLFANDPGMNELEPFLKRLAGLVKYVVSSKEGIISLTELAQAAAQTEALTLLGLSWLETEGQISINQSEDGWLNIQREHIPVLSLASASINEEIKLLMNESRLFQEYYLTASPDNFIKAFGSKS